VSETLVPQIWSCGGGTQSCAIGALIVQGKLPKPYLSVIADTGREMPTTWQYLDAVLRPALAKVGVEIVRVKKDEWATPRGRLLFATSGQLMIPAYTNQSGEPAKLSAFCSSAWKQEVVDRWLSITHGLTRSKYVKWRPNRGVQRGQCTLPHRPRVRRFNTCISIISTRTTRMFERDEPGSAAKSR